MYKFLKNKYNKSDFDLFIIEEGNKILDRANEIIRSIR